jgi:hypothetical protein
MELTPNLVVFYRMQTFAVTHYGNRPCICQIHIAAFSTQVVGLSAIYPKNRTAFLLTFGKPNRESANHAPADKTFL